LVRFVGERLGVEYITLFAFSTENWQRPTDEVDFLMDLLARFIDDKLREFVEAGIRLNVIGEIDDLPSSLRSLVERAAAETADGRKLCLTIALSYGARQELVRACARIAEEVSRGALDAAHLSAPDISARLFTAGIPDPDLVIRTSGEMRLSNFLLWQAAYAELWFTDVLWPDFTPAEFLRAIDEYQRRERRFGSLPEGGR
jgi:undecaprenyl diphosphate synthase